MKNLENFKLLALSLFIVAGLAACDKPGAAESAGKSIDQTASDAGKKMGEAADKVSEKVSEQSAKAGGDIADAEITSKIKAAIFAEPGLKTLQISVDTVNGVVTLSGSVDSLASSNLVKGLASAVAGVKEVDNRLQIKMVK
jgi:osmotically-inducible protein OsmY